MKVALLLDSSEKCLTVGLSENGKVIDFIQYEAWQKQSEFMVNEIDGLLKKHSLSRSDIEAVSASKGPGSYTGVRIALTIAKTIVFALQVPLYLSSSLEVLREKGKPSICLSNARGKRSYVGIYEGQKCLTPDSIWDNSAVMAYLEEHPDVVPCGDLGYLGLEGQGNHICEALAENINEAHLESNSLGARPIYLKDDYQKGNFKTIIRKAMPSDIFALMEICASSLHSPYTEEQMLYEMSSNPVANVYSAVVDSQVVGFIDFMITFDSATICLIAVKEEFRNKGIGNLLLGQMLKDCRSQAEPVEFVTLEVRESNVNAQRFYKKHKFEAVTVKKAYYTDGENAVYMVRSIINNG